MNPPRTRAQLEREIRDIGLNDFDRDEVAQRVAAALDAVHDDHGCVALEDSVCLDKALTALRGKAWL